MFLFEDIRVEDLDLRLELKSDLRLEKVGEHWTRDMTIYPETNCNAATLLTELKRAVSTHIQNTGRLNSDL